MLHSCPIGDLVLESGEIISEFSISYATHGELNSARSNAILMVTAIGANHTRLDFLIGPGRALDTDTHFIICANAIGNGLTTSPSTSSTQPRLAFPRFTIRDMVASQHALLTQHLGITHVAAVIGPSMGGVQALQWGVSHPAFMDAIVALVPLAKTPAWTIALLDATRQAIMLDPAWNNGNYTSPPARGIALWRTLFYGLAARTPEFYRDQFTGPREILPWLHQQSAALTAAFDANDWLYQTWAYERHDLGTTPGFGGDTAKALAAIQAPTLMALGTHDLVNPEWEPRAAARLIPNAHVVTISPGSITGHAAASGIVREDVAFLDAQIARFLSIHCAS